MNYAASFCGLINCTASFYERENAQPMILMRLLQDFLFRYFYIRRSVIPYIKEVIMEQKMKMNIEHLVQQLEFYKGKRDMIKVLTYTDLLYAEAVLQQDYLHRAIALYYRSFCCFSSGKYTIALKAGVEGLGYCEKYSYSKYYVLLCNIIGVCYGTLNDQINSLSYFLKAYYKSLENDSFEERHMIINNIGTIFQNLGFYDKALEYFLRCLKERKLNADTLNINDGILIINVIGAYVKSRKLDELKSWMELLAAYQEKFDNEVVNDDFHLYQIYLATYEENDDKIVACIDEMIRCSHDNLDVLHTFKNLLEVMDICLSLKDEDLCLRVYAELQRIQDDYQDVHNEVRLNERKVVMYQLFHHEEELLEALRSFYDSKVKGNILMQQDMKKNLLMKIDLERLMHEQDAILRKNEELLRNNELDEFTRVYHKESFRKHVCRDLQHNLPDQYNALFIIDIDHFKQVNDTYGHLVGDEVLLQVAEILRTSVRETEYVGRIGGDEFSIFMKNIYAKDYVEEKAEQILTKIRNIRTKDITEEITASIGICMSNHADQYEWVFEMADEAMYEVKERGRNHYHITLNKT